MSRPWRNLDGVSRIETRGLGLDCRKPTRGDPITPAQQVDSCCPPVHADAVEAASPLSLAVGNPKQAEEQTRLSQLHLGYLTKYANDLIILLDDSFHFLETNERVVDFYGYTREELIGMHATDLRVPDKRALFNEQSKLVGLTDRVVYETVHQRKDGTQFPVEISLRAVDVDGKRLYHAVIRDITERKRAEESLRKSETLYRTLFQSANDAIFVMNDKVFIDCNSLATRFFGAPREKLVGHSPLDYSPATQPDGRSSSEAAAEKIGAAMDGKPQMFEWTHQRANGQLVFTEVSLNRIEGQQEPLLLAIVRDITDRKHAEEALHRAHDELEQRVLERTAQLAAKNEELKGFTYTVSHDLKAPLRGIAGYAGELDRKHRDGLSERGRFCVDQILTAAQHQDQLIEDLLHYSRLDTETPSLVNVNPQGLVEALLKDRSLIIAEHRAEVTVDIGFNTLRTWENGLAHMMTNLIENALKYSRKATPPRVAIRAEESSDAWRFSVSDNGIGFDMKYHDRIFGLFNRLVREEEFEGTGAGLAIVKKVVDKLGGRIWAESALGQGATFFVELPKATQHNGDRAGP